MRKKRFTAENETKIEAESFDNKSTRRPSAGNRTKIGSVQWMKKGRFKFYFQLNESFSAENLCRFLTLEINEFLI